MSDDAAWRRHISAGEFTPELLARFPKYNAAVAAQDAVPYVPHPEIVRLLGMVDRAAPPTTEPPRAIADGLCRIECPICHNGCVPSFGQNYRCIQCNAELLPPVTE